MIQAAHVGVGISGVEGLQAARASDYSIAQFRYRMFLECSSNVHGIAKENLKKTFVHSMNFLPRYLKRLLLVHGRWNYRRISKIILYSFYKNIVLYISQFWFALFNGFSGTSYYERWTLGQFNVLFTFIPVIFFGVLDQDVSEALLLEYPQLYTIGLRKYHVRLKSE